MNKMSKENQGYDLDVTKEIVCEDIIVANICYKLLFHWVNGLLSKNKKFYSRYEGMFFYIREAIVNQYVFTLAKLFASDKEASLSKLILQTKEVSDELFELRLERYATAPHKKLREQREEFFNKSEDYLKKIRKIKKKINPLRNTQRAHNFPLTKSKTKTIWNNSKEWLIFAETIFVRAMDAAGKSAVRVGNFVPAEIDIQIRDFIYSVSVV
jgi:hypothetical protein